MINLFVLLQFIKFGFLCFGGGYTLIPFFFEQFVEVEHLLTAQEFGNLSSISQITPGAVSINSATYIGYLKNGLLGGIVASIGLVLPGIFLVTLAIYFLNKYKDNFFLNNMLYAARLAVTAIVMYAVLIFMGMSVLSSPIPWRLLLELNIPNSFYIHIPSLIICLICVFLLFKTKISIVFLIFVSAMMGVMFSFYSPANQILETPVFEQTIDNSDFYSDECENGEYGGWAGACACYPQEPYSGKYCAEKSTSVCSQTKDCLTGDYCNISGRKKGLCFKAMHYGKISVGTEAFIVSRSLLGFEDVARFCEAFGGIPLQRHQFNCSGAGVGCIDTKYLNPFQETIGTRAFIWLEKTNEPNRAYYLDLNDGIIYNTSVDSTDTAQGGCLLK